MAVCFGLVCGTAVLWSRLVTPTEDVPLTPTSVEGRLNVKNFSYSSPGAHPWELAASSALVTEGLDRVKVTAPRVRYFRLEGGEVTLSAAEGELDRKTGDVTARGDVTVKYGGFTFKTSDLRYSQRRLTASTTSAVTLRGDSLLLSGKSFKLTLEPPQVMIEEDVEAQLYNVKWTEPGRKAPL
jgi:LPS export ABC transporter protein LptC